ncbi:hypothetical protein [Streptomyces sp. MA5143a]|nr:hypothetical protein [Streptomyces sp. MA5143a]SPE99912.1 hypothetical protein SMA5143A_0621 [Streptomyces sp. MA5143a]
MTIEIGPLQALRSGGMPESDVPPLAAGTVALWLLRAGDDTDA